MTTGTKLFLAAFALLIGVLVVYYGIVAPKGQVEQPLEALIAQDPAAGITPSPPTQEPIAPAGSTTSESLTTPPQDGFESSDRLADASMESQDGFEPGPSALDPARPSLVLPLVNIGGTAESSAPAEQAEPAALGPDAGSPTNPPAVRPDGAVKLVRPQVPRHGAPSVQRKTTEYIVASGDTMSSIAEKWFGDPTKWSLIAKANPWVDPARMQIGQKLQLPPKDAGPEPMRPVREPGRSDNPGRPAAERLTYTVRSGDTLAKIAREWCGNVGRWREIYDLNKSIIGDDPAALAPGMKLTLPRK